MDVGTSNALSIQSLSVLLTGPSARCQALSNHTARNADEYVRAGRGQAATVPATFFSSLLLVILLLNSKVWLNCNGSVLIRLSLRELFLL